jgi:hypothetical protein
MNITNTIITRQADATTGNARYRLEYSIVGGALTRVSASVFQTPAEGGTEELYLGNIYFEGGSIGCSLQSGVKTARFFEDFEGLLTEINKDVKETIKNK